MNKALIDFIGQGGQHQGDVVSYLAASRLNPDFMRPAISDEDGRTYFTVYIGGDRAKPESYQVVPRDLLEKRGQIAHYGTLRRDEWKHLDEAVQQASAVRLGGIADLVSRGLTYQLGNAIGTTVLEYHSISQAMEALVSMDPEIRSTKDRPVYGTHYMPIPLIHSDFSISSRVLAASRALGNPLDTDSVFEATRVVNEKLESMLFTSYSYAFGGGTIYSYLSHPNRNQFSLTGAWTGLTGAQIVSDVLDMKQASINDRHYGPWVLYVPANFETVLDNDYDATTPGTTTRERILKIAGIEDVKVIDLLTASNVLLVEMNQRTVRLVQGMPVQVIQWQVGHQLSPTDFKVVTIQVPQVRDDKAGHCGVVHGS